VLSSGLTRRDLHEVEFPAKTKTCNCMPPGEKKR